MKAGKAAAELAVLCCWEQPILSWLQEEDGASWEEPRVSRVWAPLVSALQKGSRADFVKCLF